MSSAADDLARTRTLQTIQHLHELWPTNTQQDAIWVAPHGRTVLAIVARKDH
ncbi:MAG: hypothetical protein JO182_06510, partial [Acidobacteriaceae bacterium]|nr:hypothetical protein [Acidobacteriaceae bacterium]